MKTISIPKMLSATMLVVMASCSESTTASLDALRDRAEDRLVEAVGEGDVAIRLMQNQYGALKENVISLKTMKATYTRRLQDAETQAAALRAQGKDEMAGREERRAAMFRERLAWIGERDVKAEADLQAYAETYRNAKQEIEFLQEELGLYRTAAGLDERIKSGGDDATREEKIRKLEEALRQKVDRAKAIIETNAPVLN